MSGVHPGLYLLVEHPTAAFESKFDSSRISITAEDWCGFANRKLHCF